MISLISTFLTIWLQVANKNVFALMINCCNFDIDDSK